jgi:hypothetical protein
MTARLVVAVTLASLALVALVLAAIRPPRRALMVSAVMVSVAVVVLAVNEYVRSDDLWAS